MEKNIEQFIYKEIINGKGEVTFDYLGKKSIMKAMESYAQYKVNELNKSGFSGTYPPRENIESVINMLRNHCYSEEECEEVNWNANKIEHLDATAFENSVCIKLLGGYDKSLIIKPICEHKDRWVGKAVIEYCKDCKTALQIDEETVL